MVARLGGDPNRATLRGRAAECAELDRVLAAVREGKSRVLVVRGDAGIGKSALLSYVVDSVGDLRLLRAVGVESDMELAFAALHQLCAPLLDRLSNIPAPQRNALETVFGMRTDSPPDHFLVGLAVLSLLSDVSGEQPLLCVVDDVQWLDRASAQVLGFVARRLMAEPVVFLFAARDPGQELAGLPDLEVTGLREADARALLAPVFRYVRDDTTRSRILAEARGNPLALLELPRGLTAAEITGGMGLRDGPALSERIEDSFSRQLQALPKDSQLLLLVAAAEPVGDPLLLWRAAERLGLQARAADVAEAQGLISIEERVVFRHPLARSAVYHTATAEQRRTVHQALADATDRQIDPDRRAWHLASAVSGTDEEVARELEQSADRAQARGGLVAAAAFLHRAFALTGDAPRRAERALGAAAASLQAGRFAAARGVLDAAEAGSLTELQHARVTLLRGQIALFVSLGSDAAPLLLGAAQALSELAPELARDTYLDAWFAALVAGQLSTGASLSDISRAARAAPRPPGDVRPADLLLEGLSTLITEGGSAAAELLSEATKAFVNESSVTGASQRWSWLTVVPTYVLWDEDGTDAICVRTLRGLRQAGALARLPLDLNHLGMFTLRCGDLPAAEELIDNINTAIEAAGTTLPPYVEMMLAAVRGREAEAEALIASVARDAAALGQGLGVQTCHWMRAILCNGLGRYQDAMTAALAASEDTPELYVSAWATVELVEAAERNNNREVAKQALERVVASTTVAGSDSALGLQARSRALLSDGEAADGLYQQAIERLGRTRLRPELARAHLLYGEWLRRESRRVDARMHLRAAYEQFTSIGMEAFAERSRRELLATGEKVRKRTAETSDDLTAQERQIALLVRDGLSNSEVGARLFLSPRTVEWHLGKIFAKLSIGTRKQLREALPDPAWAPSRG
ncbi:MAG TPA: AAA family ATPase [Candidatus Acidoferrum sp.]|nr:AAA family ATPase [Candidatus Acidoferrum sp.]